MFLFWMELSESDVETVPGIDDSLKLSLQCSKIKTHFCGTFD